MLQLQFVGSHKPPIWLVKDQTTIGTASDCDVVLPAGTAEAVHAEIKLNHEQLLLIPFFRVLVDGMEILGEHTLSHGVNFVIGDVEFGIVDPKLGRLQKVADASSSLSQWALVSMTSALASKRFVVGENDVVGRAKECEICLAVSHLSRRHARLTSSPEGLWVEDLESANGTFINGERIQRKRAHHGDEIRFDNLSFRVIAPGKSDVEDSDQDRTSLRPAIPLNPNRAADKPLEPQVHARSAIKREPLRPQTSATKSVPATDTNNSSGSAATLWVGVTLVAILTVSAIIYLVS